MKGEDMGAGQQRREIDGTGKNDEGTMRDVTFAGPRGHLLCAYVQRVSAGLADVDKAVPELTRRPDGILSLKVSNSTIDVITGRAKAVEADAADPLTP